MNILHLLWSRSGKALWDMSTTGILAAVGVGMAGIAALHMFGPSNDVNPNTAFSSSEEQIVYVAGGPGVGGYGGIGYGEGGEVRSGIHAKMSRDMQLMREDYQQQTAMSYIDRQDQQIESYKMDGTSEGLGMGQNAVRAKALGGGGDMKGLQAQMAAMQQQMSDEQKKAEAAAAASAASGAGSAEAAAAAALAKQGKGGSDRYGMNAGMAHASGNNLNSTPLQAGVAGSSRGGTLGGGVSGRSVGPMAEGSTLTPKFEGGRDAVFGRGGSMSAGDTLLAYSKQSAAIAGNDARSATDAASMFLGNLKLSGGVMINGEKVGTGTGASSADFSDPDFSGLNGAIGGAAEEFGSYAEDRKQLQEDLKSFAKKASWCSAIPVLGIIAGYAACSGARKNIKKKVQAFKSKWGETDYETSNTHGAFWGHAQDSYRDIYNAIGFTGIPWAVYKRDAKKIWNANDAGETEERKDGDIRSPFGSSYASDALQVGSLGCGY